MKQYTTPLVINGNNSTKLERVSLSGKGYDESWIQSICYENSDVLPIDEIEPSLIKGDATLYGYYGARSIQMPIVARTVLAKLPHCISQREIRCETVYLND